MSGYSKQEIQSAREMDLLTYLSRYDPSELVHVSGEEYCTRTHDSLRISHGLWCWNSRGIGGRSALDYLIKVEGLSFPQAVGRILSHTCGQDHGPFSVPGKPPAEKKPRVFVLPERAESSCQAIRYLTGARKIDREIVSWCIEQNFIYEGLYRPVSNPSRAFHNVVFVGYDARGTPRYAGYRSILGKSRGDCPGSDKRFSFRILGTAPPKTLHLFEAPVEALSYATLVKRAGENWRALHYKSLCGLPQLKDDHLPIALEQELQTGCWSRIALHFNADEAGRTMTRHLQRILSSRMEVVDRPPPIQGDFNDYLCIQSRKNFPQQVR